MPWANRAIARGEAHPYAPKSKPLEAAPRHFAALTPFQKKWVFLDVLAGKGHIDCVLIFGG
ncbi:hypothetical protein HMPREF3198_01063 [Winkia neuii]|nr:hypothetical protein HMPREF3198_01063 [Winkia neuii]